MGNIVSSIFGSGKSGSSSSSGDAITGAAWAAASPLYNSVMANGQNVLSNIMANPVYTGQRVAGLNDLQTGSANNLGSFANNTMGNAYNLINAGNANLNAGSNYGSNAQSIFNRYNGVDPTQSIINNANLYANNPYISGLIDASSRDVTRNLFENQLPGVNRAASGTGNLNSTRAGVESAIATRGAADRLADMSSQIRSQFFGKGLDMSQSQYNQDLQNTLAANNQLLNAANLGNNLINSGQQFATNNFGQGQAAGGVFQQQNQNELNAAKAQFDERNANLLNALKTMAGVANSGSGWNGGAQSKTSSETSTPSLASIGGSLLKAFF